MCATNDGNHFFRPMSAKDVVVMKGLYPTIKGGFIDKIFAAMTDHNTVKPAVMVVLLEGIRRLESGLLGKSSFGATFAYSALQIRDGGMGKSSTDSRTPSWLMSMMPCSSLRLRNATCI